MYRPTVQTFTRGLFCLEDRVEPCTILQFLYFPDAVDALRTS